MSEAEIDQAWVENDQAWSNVDQRLLDAVAMCLCWAEFGPASIRARADTPAAYWSGISDGARRRYYRDAAVLARAMMNDTHFAVVPTTLSDEMLAASGLQHRWRAEKRWREMISQARKALNWRKPA